MDYVSKFNNILTIKFRVSTLKDLVGIILLYFDNYSLITKKHSDHLLFKQIALFILNKEHNTLEGVQKTVNLKISLN